MGDNSIINIGDLSKPATVLIEKVSDAVGGIFLPYQIERVTKAQAKANKIKAISDIEITKLQRRALVRLLQEESDKQKNIEEITKKAIPSLVDDAKPNEVEKDWLVNFFDKARLISDSEMQDIWSKLLASEANKPGSFSKRTISLISSLDKQDAILFTKLCNFAWRLGENLIPIIFDSQNEFYTKNGINFASLKHLDAIGLISFEALTGYTLTDLPKKIKISYMGEFADIVLTQDEKNELVVGSALFTSVGKELFHICETSKIDGFMDYALARWGTGGNKAERSRPS